jgi:hypothetical protein
VRSAAWYLVARAVLFGGGILALTSVPFTMDPLRNIDLPLVAWLTRPAGWSVAGFLLILAGFRLRDRPMDAWIVAPLAAILITIVSFFEVTLPPALLLSATVAGVLAPWFAVAFPLSVWRGLFVGANLAVIVAADRLVTVFGLPHWLTTFVPIDPEAVPSWLLTLPLDWPWKVAAAPILFGSLEGPVECCGPVNSPLYAVVPAALAGLVIWYRGRRRPESRTDGTDPPGDGPGG